MDLPKYFFDTPGTALLIGVGGGSIMKQYARDSWNVDAVEIDPNVVTIAKNYFGLKPEDGSVFETDGREYLASTANHYDVILFDAFGSGTIPFHLVTREVFALAANRLRAGGILAINMEAIGWHDPIVYSIAATLRSVFPNVLALPMEEPPDQFGNVVLLASVSPLVPKRLPEDNVTLEPDWRYGPGYQKIHAWDNRFIPDITRADILTDDSNPIDIRGAVINDASRKELHEYFLEHAVSW